MIQMLTILNAADNSGAKTLQCIKVWIFKGEVFDAVPEVVEEAAADAAAAPPAAEQPASA